MTFLPKYVCILLLVAFFNTLQGQTNDCDYYKNETGIPVGDSSFLAEYKLTSSHTIESTLPIYYGAGFEICMDTGFYINQGSQLTADLDGCTAKCIPANQICDETCISPLDDSDSTTTNEQRYLKYEVVITFPDSIDNLTFQNFSFGGFTQNWLYVNGSVFNISDTMSTYFPKIDPTMLHLGTLKRCLCDKNIFLYSNDNLIFEEGGIAQRNRSSGGISEEGGVYSLNYILEHFEPQIPNGIVSTKVSFADKGYYPDGTKIIAILDSGLDPKYVPNNSLYYDPNMAFSVCGLNDISGWNFVDNNNDLKDDRGHGTLVALSYFHALDRLDPQFPMTRQSLLTVKVLNECGEGTTYSTLCGLRYAELKGAEVINTSWGMYQNDRQLQRAIEELNKKGIFIVTSAGNRSLDLAKSPHFPSGYSGPFDYIVDEDNTEQRQGMENVIEVGGMCKYINSQCDLIQENTPLSTNSNYRDVLFVEASKRIEDLLPPGNRPTCEIEGTSYAAPQFAAGAIHGLVNGVLLKKDEMWSRSKRIHPNNDYRSYIVAECKP